MTVPISISMFMSPHVRVLFSFVSPPKPASFHHIHDSAPGVYRIFFGVRKLCLSPSPPKLIFSPSCNMWFLTLIVYFLPKFFSIFIYFTLLITGTIISLSFSVLPFSLLLIFFPQLTSADIIDPCSALSVF